MSKAVLIVEDDPQLGESLKTILSLLHHEPHHVFKLKEAKEAIDNQHWDVIISDYLISQIKKHKSNTEYLCPFTKNGIESFFRRFKHRNNIEKLTVYDCTRRQCAKDVVRRKLPLPDIAKTFGWSWKTAHDMIELYSGAKALRNYD